MVGLTQESKFTIRPHAPWTYWAVLSSARSNDAVKATAANCSTPEGRRNLIGAGTRAFVTNDSGTIYRTSRAAIAVTMAATQIVQ